MASDAVRVDRERRARVPEFLSLDAFDGVLASPPIVNAYTHHCGMMTEIASAAINSGLSASS